MSISENLSWEIVAMNDRGDAFPAARTALEICYGVSLAQGNPGSFVSTMNEIIGQVSDQELRRHLTFYTQRGLK